MAPTTNIIRRIVAGMAKGTVTSMIFNISSSMALSLSSCYEKINWATHL